MQPGIFGPGRMPVLRDAPYAENSNDSAWLANADRPVTGYERVFGTIGTARSIRTRGAIDDVAAMAAKGDLSQRDLLAQQFTNRAPAGDLAADDAAKACAALPGRRATGVDGSSVDVSAACRALAAWDHTMDTGSRGALLFDRFWRRLTSLTPTAQLWKVPFSAADPVHTPNTLDTGAPGFATALADAVTELRTAGIPLDSPLGAHQFVVRDGKRIPVPGGTESLGVWDKVEPVWDPAAAWLHRGHHRVLVHPGGRLGRGPLPGRPYAPDVLPVVRPGLAALQRPDTAVLRRAVGHLPVLREGHPVLARSAGDPRGRAPLTVALSHRSRPSACSLRGLDRVGRVDSVRRDRPQVLCLPHRVPRVLRPAR